MSYFRSKHLLAANALNAKDWAAPSTIKLARHMAHDGATIEEIIQACGWNVGESAARKRLKKFNIHHGTKMRRAWWGDLTSLPPGEDKVDFRPFRARRALAS